ncbi:hypothetical protein BDQ17DRAFT_1492761 [Cyathus striatus]|nr:hypothetical protein BDQ17DRAFT_1492761 [Cyathus striatus]
MQQLEHKKAEHIRTGYAKWVKALNSNVFDILVPLLRLLKHSTTWGIMKWNLWGQWSMITRCGVNHEFSDSEDEMLDWLDEDEEGVVDRKTDAELEELVPHEVLESLWHECQLHADLDVLSRPTHYERILANKPARFWKKAKSQCFLGYNGMSDQTQRHHAKLLRDKETKDAVIRQSNSAAHFQSFFTVNPKCRTNELQEENAVVDEILVEIDKGIDDSF